MKIAVALLLWMFASIQAIAQQNVWKPNASFQLERADLQQTMLFVSGMGYGLTEYSNELKKNGKLRLFCPSGSGFVTSKMIFEILNSKHSGQIITSEQAVSSTITALKERFPCK